MLSSLSESEPTWPISRFGALSNRRPVDRSSNNFTSTTISLVWCFISLKKSFMFSMAKESDFQSLNSTGRTYSELTAEKGLGWNVDGRQRTAITSGAYSL